MFKSIIKYSALIALLLLNACDKKETEELTPEDICFYKITPVKPYGNMKASRIKLAISSKIDLDIAKGEAVASYPIYEGWDLYLAGECEYIRNQMAPVDNVNFTTLKINSELYFQKFNKYVKGIEIIDE